MGAVARHELAAAVSEAGGLGTIGGARAPIAEEIAAARRLTGRPIAVNLVLPLLRPGDAQAAAGADAVIAQGVEAGGHVRGTMPVLELVERVRAAVKVPVLAAGGIVDRAGVERALEAGAAAAVLGTRFLLSEESRAHPDYKQRCLEAEGTVLTELFGLGWADAPHRVIPNAATRRWLGDEPRGPGWIRLANRLASPLAARLPLAAQDRWLAAQRPSLPFLAPPMALDDGPPGLLDSGPLYAGANVSRISDISPAAQIVNDLVP